MAPGRVVEKAITFYCENSFDLRDPLEGPFRGPVPHCDGLSPTVSGGVCHPPCRGYFLPLLPYFSGSPVPGSWRSWTQRGQVFTPGSLHFAAGGRDSSDSGWAGCEDSNHWSPKSPRWEIKLRNRSAWSQIQTAGNTERRSP